VYKPFGKCVRLVLAIINQLHFATNGFASQLLPDLDVAPARAQVLITSPISDLKVRGTFHIDEGFFYFRNVGNRLLLGGGRNLDIEGETTSEMQISRLIQGKLDELLSQTILPDSDYTIEHRWAGIMGVGQQKRTIIKRLSDNVSCSVRLGGMGVAIGTSIGKESAELIAQNKSGDKS
jgi:glycine/D-amino acid oxidase-like deaminating enzyme